MPNISVFIPLYNAEQYITSTVQSVLNQTWQDFEIIILEDCSTDKSYEIASEIAKKDDRIKLYRNEVNLGMLENWNKGIELCQQPYFVKLDADDLWEVDFLEKSLAVLENYPEVGLVFSKYVLIDSAGNKVPNSEWDLPEFANNKPFSGTELVKMGPGLMLSFPILRQGLSLMRREIFDEIGKYNYLLTPETLASTDTEFYFRLGAHYKIFCINEELYLYRIHNNSISRKDENDGLNDLKLYEIRICIFDYYFKQGLLSFKEHRHFSNKASMLYQPSLINFYNKNKEYLKSLKAFFMLFSRHSFFTIKFYSKRIYKKFIAL
tara:strand:+ start:46 stop:1008 length:963 start_codon:yes stop_codon:yes gene_type:complete